MLHNKNESFIANPYQYALNARLGGSGGGGGGGGVIAGEMPSNFDYDFMVIVI